MDKAVATLPRQRAGRPTREQAEARHNELLDAALDHFLDKGFEQATIEAIANAVGMTKRTVYARYEDKSALFRATVQRAIERWIVPIEDMRAAESDDLEATLVGIAEIRLRNAISPVGLRLQRIVNAESYRFPEIFDLAYEQGTRPTIRYLADLLTRYADRGALVIENAEIAAATFLSMVIGGPTRAIVRGGAVNEAALESRIRICVRMFLNGVRPR
jgi:AcrR family transcriptional regulator